MSRASATATMSLSPAGAVAYARPMSENPDDSALMLRYRDGDIAAFETLYRRHKDSLYRYLLRVAQNPDTAEDVFQDVWGKIIVARQRYRPTAKFTTYLYTVAHNCFIDYVRRNNRHRIQSVMDPDCSPDPSDAPDLVLDKQLARRKFLVALDTLPDEQRDAFLLHAEAGLNIDAISSVTGVNRETIKSRLRYANRKLKAALDESDPGAEQSSRTAGPNDGQNHE